MVGRHGEVDVDAAVGGNGLHAFVELLLERGAGGAAVVAVEGEQCFGQGAVVHAFGTDDGADEVAVAPGGCESGSVDAEHACGGRVELGAEGQAVEVLDELGHGRAGGGCLHVAVGEGEQGLEHARCGAGCGHELGGAAAVGEEAFPAADGAFLLGFVKHMYAGVGAGRALEFQVGEAGGEALHLRVELLGGVASLAEAF